MNATYTKETAIDTLKALTILESQGHEDLYTEGSDYYIACDAEGREYLTEAGQDEPLAQNHGSTSWTSPGYPA